MKRPPLLHVIEWELLEPPDLVRANPRRRRSSRPSGRDLDAVARYDETLQQAASGNDRVVFLGDSIHGLVGQRRAGASVWNATLAKLKRGRLRRRG